MSQPSPSKPADERETSQTGERPATTGENDAGEESDESTTAMATEDLRALYLDSDDAGELISSLSSETARSVLVSLHESPATASELAEVVDTSVQNVRHHLDSLREADLVRASETRYSSKGREMDVYAPVDRPLVVVVGNGNESTEDGRENRRSPDTEDEGFVDSLSRFVGAVVGLAAASLVVHYTVVWQADGPAGLTRVPDGLGGTGLATAPPGLLFFAGGALVLAVASIWRYWRRSHGGRLAADA